MGVTDEPQARAMGGVEHVAVVPSVALLRVNGRSSQPRPAPDWRPTLIADHGSGPERFAALPSPPDAEGVLRAAYSVPTELVTAEPRFWLELQDGEIVELGAPVPGTPRRAISATRADADPPAEASDQLATLTASLAEARDRATRLQAENETLSATLAELEIWRGVVV